MTLPAAERSRALPAVSIVTVTRNRRDELVSTLARLQAMVDCGEVSAIVVVDNASEDGTAAAVAEQFPGVVLRRQRSNLGAVGRTVGVEQTTSELIAFADDDSWWEPGSLTEAAGIFASCPSLGLLHGRLVVEPDGEVDDLCRRMAQGPRDPNLPGPSILGHLGCAVVVRRDAFLQAGGYSPLLGFGGEEGLLSLDLAAAGWEQCYVDSVIAHHAPSSRRDEWLNRWARYRRNDTLTALLRFPAPSAAGAAAHFAWDAIRKPVVRRELPHLVKHLPAVARRRQPVPAQVWARWKALRSAG